MGSRIFLPGPTPNTVRTADGTILSVPDGWALLPPGDGGLTRRVKAAGDHWVVQEKVKGKRREVRRVLARRSQELLQRYCRCEPAGEDFPLKKALAVEE